LRGPKALDPCVDEIIRVFRRLDELERGSRKTGFGYNAGNGLVGCAAYCLERYFPDNTPEQCRSSLATFDRLAKVKPYLRRTAIRSTMAEKCKAL
jgi:hypothetical protein